MQDNASQIEQIHRKLAEARRKDRDLKVFGAQKHRYEIRPVKPRVFEEFEGKFGVTLPSDYKEFLEHVGLGAGPFYGIHGPEWGAGIMINDPEVHLRVPSSLTPGMSEEEWLNLPLMRDEDFDDDHYELARSKTYAGVLPIGDQGCAHYSCLVVQGPAHGRVVYLGEDEMQPFFAYEETFLDWYERWLDEILTGQLLQPYAGWFGAHRGGSEEKLLSDFESFLDETRKLQCLVGLLVKMNLSAETLERLWDISEQHSGPVQKQALVILLKFDYQRAEPVLKQQLYPEDPLTIFQNLHWYGKEHAERWSDEIKKLLGRPTLDPELFRFITYVMEECRTNLKPLLKPWMQHEDKALRDAACYAYNKKEESGLFRRARDWFPWLP